MGWLDRAANAFRRRQLDDEIDEELRFHVESRAADLERQGRSPIEARREARRLLGNASAVRDHTRDTDVWVVLETAVQDVRYALRLLWRSPLFAIAASLTLALGIGVNTAMFGVLYGVLIRPLPYPDADRLYLLYQENPPAGRTRAAPLDYVDWQQRSRAFRMAGVVGTGFTLTGRADAELVIGQLVAGDFFGLLGVQPALGRTFAADERDRSDKQVMVLSHRLWQRRFAGDPRILGSTVMANGRPFTIVGVMPPGFSFRGDRYELWIPFPLKGANPDNLPVNRMSRYMQVVGRLESGVTPTAAAQDLNVVARAMAAEYPDTHAKAGIAMASLMEETIGDVRPVLQLLSAAVVLVLLIACGNVMSLLLARFSVRSSEVLVRAALGASRARVIRQFLTETFVLYAIGTASGVLIAYGLLSLLRIHGADVLPRSSEIGLLPPVLVFTCGLTLAAAIIFGVAPAWQTTRTASASRSLSRATTTARPHQRFRSAVVVGQIAVALCLLSGASLVARSLANLQGVDKGFDPEGRSTFMVVMPAARFSTAQAMHTFYRQLLESLNAQPGFTSVGLTTHLPLSGQDLENSFEVEGYVAPSPEQEPIAGMRGISPAYPAAMGLTVRAGRAFTEADDERAAPVVLVNEAFVRRYLSGGDPLGRRVSAGGPWRTVVGIVSDVRHREMTSEPRPEVLIPYLQLDEGFLTAWARGLNVVVRSEMSFAGAAGLIRPSVRSVDPNVPVIELRPMTTVVSQALAEPRFRTYLLALFAGVAVLLAAIGIFGVLSYLVSERTREIGIRMALGAQPGAIFSDVLVQGMKLTVLGTVLGLAAGALLTRWISVLLYRVSPADPFVIGSAALVLAGIALAAASIPARRATRVDPIVSLRS